VHPGDYTKEAEVAEDVRSFSFNFLRAESRVLCFMQKSFAAERVVEN